jgi:hypothetical protein
VSFTLRTIDPQSNFASQITMQALEEVIPRATVEAVLTGEQAWHERERKFSMTAVVLVIIAMNLYRHLALGHVIRRVVQGLRFLWPDPTYPVPGASAFSYRRYQLGVSTMEALFKQIARPLATPQTPGAFLFGRRLMALDGTTITLPDTPENEAAFGRHKTGRGRTAFPQAQCVFLAETGTHAVIDAGFWPVETSERVGAWRLLRALDPGMLIMWDRGLHSFDMVQAASRRGADVLSRLPGHVKPEVICVLPDGSRLVRLYPSQYRRRNAGEHLVLRLVEYVIEDQARPGHGERHRLVTTLLDPDAAPAKQLACAYHERWEVELTIDEIKTHELFSHRLRSQKPVGVLQELYGVLLAHFAVRALMHEAALAADLDPDRLSFVHALRVIGDAMAEFAMVVEAEWPRLYARLLSDVAALRLPERRLRSNPRVVRRKMSSFKVKRRRHQHWPQPTKPFADVVTLI